MVQLLFNFFSIFFFTRFYIIFTKALIFKMNDSSIFSKRLIKDKVIGGIRFASTSLSPKKQFPRFERPFRLSKNNFKKNLLIDKQNIIFPTQKIEKTTQNSSSLSPQHNPYRSGRYKLCTSKNVCVFSNLQKVQLSQQLEQKTSRKDLNFEKIKNSRKQQKELMILGSVSPRFKKSKDAQLSKTHGWSFKLRKISSSQSCREKNNHQQKLFDRWHNQDHTQDPEIIFYK